jgi:DNA repair protein RadD
VSVVLRDYQAEGTSRLRCEYAGGKRAVLFVLATGGGKTICFAYITHGAASKRKRVLIVAHRRELIKQASRKLSEAGVEHGIIAPGFTPTHDAVQVASIQTLANRLDKIGQPSFSWSLRHQSDWMVEVSESQPVVAVTPW